ncbi:MAG: hypothetical protein WCH85_04755 [Methanomicrobiales archaeon]
MNPNFPLIVIAVLFLCCLCIPAGATIQEVTVKGTVAAISPVSNTLTLDHPRQYGCSYPARGGTICTYTPMSVETLTGTVPDRVSFSVFKPGDTIVATSLGGAGGTWITLAKLSGTRQNEENVTAMVGDPEKIPTPLAAGYALDITMAPDCSACTGLVCTVESTEVKVLSNGMLVQQNVLLPGQDLHFNGRNDGSSIEVFLRNGEMSAGFCGTTSGTGLQPISVFNITVVPPVGYSQTNLGTATTTRPEEAVILPTPGVPATNSVTATAATPVPPAPLPTTKSGMQPLAAIGAAGLVGLVLVMRKN